jgi:hypothetical protein
VFQYSTCLREWQVSKRALFEFKDGYTSMWLVLVIFLVVQLICMSQYLRKVRSNFQTLNPSINVSSILFGLISACFAIVLSSIHVSEQFGVGFPLNLPIYLSVLDLLLPTSLDTILYLLIYFLIALGMGAFLPIVLVEHAIPIKILGLQPCPAAILALIFIFVWWFIIGFIIARTAKKLWKAVALWITALFISILIVVSFL